MWGKLALWRRLSSFPAGLRGASRQAGHAGSRAGRATQSRAVREFPRHPARKTACSTSRRRPQGGASRQACHAGGHAGRATQSRAVRGFARHPPPRLAAWHARLRAPLEGVARKTACSTSRGRPQGGASRQAGHAGSRAGRATQSRAVREFPRHPARKTACSTSRRRPQWSKPPGLPCGRSRRQSHTIPACAGVPTPSAAKTGGVARKTACSTLRRRPQWSKPPGLPGRRSRGQSHTIPSCAGVPTPSAAKTGGVARKTACSTSRGRPQGGASRQACQAGGHAGRATQSRAVRGFPRHPARKTACSTSRGRPQGGASRPACHAGGQPFPLRMVAKKWEEREGRTPLARKVKRIV